MQDVFKLKVFGSIEGPPVAEKGSGGTKRKADDPEVKVRREKKACACVLADVMREGQRA